MNKKQINLNNAEENKHTMNSNDVKFENAGSEKAILISQAGPRYF